MKWLSRGKLLRALLWTLGVMLVAYLLGIEWTWRILMLCLAASILDGIIYADYSAHGTPPAHG